MSAAIFKGQYVKLLAKLGLEFADNTRIVSGTLDPITTAVDAPVGSMYINTTTLGIYVKLDSGLSNNWKPMDVTNYTKEATGLADATQYTTNYDNSTRTVSITPVGAYFDVLIRGRIFRKTVAESVVHANVAGEYFIEYDDTGTLVIGATPFDFLNKAQVRVVRFDPAQTPTGISINENHGVNLPGEAHAILHGAIGTRLISGGTITAGTTITRAPGDARNAGNSTLADIQPGVDATVLADEDLRTSLLALVEATGYATLRKRWTSNNYVWTSGQVAPFYRNGIVPQYNPASGGDNLVNMTNTAYVCYYLVSIPAGIEVNSQLFRFIFVPGRTQYVPSSGSTANRTIARDLALAENPSDIDLTDFLSTEYNICHKFVVGYDTANTGNDYRLRIEGQQSVRGSRAQPLLISGVISTNHGSLSGLSDPGSHPATAISAAPTDGQLDPAIETDVELALDRLSVYSGIPTYTVGATYRTGDKFTITGYVFRVLGDFTATTWASDYSSCELINVPTVNSPANLIAVGGSYNKVVFIGSVSGYNKFYEHKTGTVTARGIPDINGVGYYDPIETNFERFAHANSFAVGDVCYRINGSTWGKAKADSEATIQTIGVISYVLGNVFHVTYGGIIQLSGRTPATSYFVSDATEGLATTTRPTTVGNFDAPIYDALTTTLVMVRPLRAVVVGATNVKSTSNHPGGTTSLVMDVSAYEGGRIEGTLIIDTTTKSWWELRFVKAADGNYYGSSSAVGDVPSGLSLAVTNAGLVQFTLPGATPGAYNYTLNGPAVGATFPLAISANNVTGRVDGVAPGAGVIGEAIELSINSGGGFATSGNYYSFSATTVQPGRYLCLLDLQINKGSASTLSLALLCLSKRATTDATLAAEGDSSATVGNYVQAGPVVNGSDLTYRGSISVPISIATAGTYYLRARADFTGTAGTPLLARAILLRIG